MATSKTIDRIKSYSKGISASSLAWATPTAQIRLCSLNPGLALLSAQMCHQPQVGFSLENFESLAYRRDRESAMRELIALLKTFDENYGQVGREFRALPLVSIQQQDTELHLWTRAAGAASCLLSDPELTLSVEWRAQILTLHRWLAALFAATPFRNLDHVMRGFHVGGDNEGLSSLQVKFDDLLKLCFVYSSESEVPLDIDGLWENEPVLAASLALVLITPRFLGSRSAHAKRELILPWLAERLDKIADIDQLPLGVLHDVYMHCSYADRADKHAIKKPINELIRRKCESVGARPWSDAEPDRKIRLTKDKPVLLVVVEWFNSGHSIYRTHSKTIEAAREEFEVVGVGYPHSVDQVTRQVFDAFIELDSQLPIVEQLLTLREISRLCAAAVCYMPSVGMFPLTMWLANFRIAPLQYMALGHPATTGSDVIDGIFVEDDYVGSEACFTERLIRIPSDGMPYRPSAAAQSEGAFYPVLTEKLHVEAPCVHIAVCATTMKLNPAFLEACSRIRDQARTKTIFHFLVGQNQGLVRPNVEHVIRQELGDCAEVYPHQAYADYMAVIRQCDLFINPFPFGNTNGVIDTVSAGLVGVCRTGPEVHEHIDEGLFRRLEFPEWLIATTTENYVEATVRLIDGPEERATLRAEYAGEQRVERLFAGRPDLLGKIMRRKVDLLASGY